MVDPKDYKEGVIRAIAGFYDSQKPKPRRKRTVKRSNGPTEEQEQIRVAALLNRLGVIWCHVPNGGYRGKIAGSRLKSQGVKPGVPDILIFDSPPSKPRAHGVAIELKRAKGGRVSKEQSQWLKDLQERGWVSLVCHGYERTVEAIEKLGWEIPIRDKMRIAAQDENKEGEP